MCLICALQSRPLPFIFRLGRSSLFATVTCNDHVSIDSSRREERRTENRNTHRRLKKKGGGGICSMTPVTISSKETQKQGKAKEAAALAKAMAEDEG